MSQPTSLHHPVARVHPLKGRTGAARHLGQLGLVKS
jgi:hypothetical protein